MKKKKRIINSSDTIKKDHISKKMFAQTKRVNALFYRLQKRFLREYYVTAKFDEVTQRLCLIASIK